MKNEQQKVVLQLVSFLYRFRLKRSVPFVSFLMLLPILSISQRVYPDMAVTIGSNGSDYTITFTYDGASVVGCSDDVKYDFDIYKNSDVNSVQTISGSGSQSSGTLTYVAGPANGGYWGLRYREWEDCGWAWCNCVEWAWSGYPRANSSDDRGGGYSVLTYASTVSIKAPTGITASDKEYYDKIVLSWNKGTDIPDGNVQYKIYRGTTLGNGTLVHTAAGSERSWTDNTIQPNDVYYYWVTTYSSTWGVQESPRNSTNAVSGKAKTLMVKASDGLYTNRVKIEWENLSEFAEEIKVERSIPESAEREELDILSKNATAYSDNEAIPGYNYTYYITPINATRTFPSFSDKGYKKPDGIIKGSIKSILGTGVEGVTVCAFPITTGLPAGAIPVPQSGYCAITDIDGYYEIRNVYYFDEAKFKIVPYKSGPVGAHIFTPDTITRLLDLNSKISSGVDFTDRSVFTVSGKIIFPVSSTGVECGVSEVEIRLNGERRGIFTDADGNWSYAIQEEGIYSFTPEFKHHKFENEDGDPSTSILVSDDIADINFFDVQVDSIFVKVQNGCGEPVGENATVRITSPGNCYNQTFQTDANGLLTLRNLPARKYDIQVIALNPTNSNVMDQIGNKPVTVDLTVRDTTESFSERDSLSITPADTTLLPNGTVRITPADTVVTTVIDTTKSEVIPRAEFIYHSPLQITVDFEDAGAEVFQNCKDDDGNSLIIMEQNGTYKLVFDVTEKFGGCAINEGVLRIFDFVSDNGDEPIEIPIVNGFATYTVTAGLPEIATSDEHNHQKLLYIIPEVGFLEAQPVEYWIMVTGVKTQAPSFITRSVELPMLILHDPPGDNSFAFVEKGTSFKSFETHEVLVGGEAGVFANLLIGAKVITPFSTNSFGTMINFKAVAGRDNFNRDGIETTITFNETFSTSDMENLTGNVGDVYIGAAFNQEFAIGDELSFDRAQCKAVLKVVPTIDVTGFATTFIYTEKHIRGTLLPKLGELRAAIIGGREASLLSEEEKIQANQLLFDSLHWENVIAKNVVNRDSKAIFKENRSFSAGASYSNTYSTNTASSVSYEYNTFVNLDLDLGIKIDNAAGAWFDSELGVTAKFRWGTKTNSGSENSASRTVGYILSDNDIGDFFSVDILEDTAYSVPAFRLKLGTTSCPHEPGTQNRDDARIQIIPPQINNVPIGGQAVFTANLLNESQSRETREYEVKVISTTNPDGAIVRIGGQQINNNGAAFFLDFNQNTSVALTVEKGPLANNYDSIGIMMYPPCEYDLWGENGDVINADTAWIFVDFQSQCSNVSLHLPGNNWLVNQNNNNILDVAFTGYDINNEFFKSVTLQYKREGEGWIDAVTFEKEELGLQNFFDYQFNVSGLPDGNYRLRAKAFCGAEGGISYSSEQIGIIDRTSLAPFGMPSPSDGYLRYGQEISVTFDKDINCNFASYDPALSKAVIRLFTENGTEIPVTVQCSQNQDRIILVPDNDLFTQPELEGVKVYAVVDSIQDIFGNVQKYKTQWSFIVNVSPVSWNPDQLHLSAEETEHVVFNANLDNSAVISKSFEISEWPEWLYPSVKSASILAGNTYTVSLTVIDGLLPGWYSGQVIALVDNVPEVLDVSLELYAEEIDWKVNPADFEYSMNIAAQFSADDGDLNLSAGLRDKIAAYVNGELRGVGNITFIPALNQYAAFINILGNTPGKNGSHIEAEEYVADLSVQDLKITDNGFASGAVRFKKANWIDFNIYATKSGNFATELRLASILSGKTADILIDGVVVRNFTVPSTGNSNTYTTYNTTIQVSAGSHTLRIQSKDAEFDLNWIKFPEYHVRNRNVDEVIKFRMWDGLNGIEYGAIEELTFFSDGVVGNAQNPFILHPAGGIQQMVLNKGWTWISINKESENMGVAKIFENITSPKSDNDITLKSQGAFSQYTKATGWQGNLSQVDLKSGYMIHLNSHPDTLSLIGKAPVNNVNITLKPKWNWIGYPKQGVKGTDEILNVLTSKAGDIVKSQYEYAEYNENTGKWIGDLKFFQPGMGYKLYVSDPDNLEINKSGIQDNLLTKYEFNMTLTAQIEFGPVTPSGSYLLRSMINGQLRGEIALNYLENLDEYFAFSMIYGDRADIGENLEISLWDIQNQQEIKLASPEIKFGIDNIAGTINQPVILSALNTPATDMSGNLFEFLTYPNPFSGKTNIRYSIPDDTYVVLTIYDSFGKEIKRLVDHQQVAGRYEYTFEAGSLASGIYLCKLKTGNSVTTQKLILLND